MAIKLNLYKTKDVHNFSGELYNRFHPLFSIFESNLLTRTKEIYSQQECIPVGHVPPAAVAIGGDLPQCMLGYIPPGCGPGTPLGVGLETPWCWPGDTTLARSLDSPPGCGPENLQGMLGYHPPPPETCCKACWDTTAMHAGIPHPSC